MTGTIKTLMQDRGFGFIVADDGKEYFFHRTEVGSGFEELNEGERVEFEAETIAPRGPRAKMVTRLTPASALPRQVGVSLPLQSKGEGG